MTVQLPLLTCARLEQSRTLGLVSYLSDVVYTLMFLIKYNPSFMSFSYFRLRFLPSLVSILQFLFSEILSRDSIRHCTLRSDVSPCMLQYATTYCFMLQYAGGLVDQFGRRVALPYISII